jgi:transcriptional regulator with XRE-family HTH domain
MGACMPKRNRALTTLGTNLLRRREAKGLSQEALAEKAALDRTYISGIERGVRNPSVLSLLRVSKALGSTVAELTQGI